MWEQTLCADLKCIFEFSGKPDRNKLRGRPGGKSEVILNKILRKQYVRVWTGSNSLGCDPIANCRKHCNE
jgi:hypothetical protein